jgi:hypothetical protein
MGWLEADFGQPKKGAYWRIRNPPCVQVEAEEKAQRR